MITTLTAYGILITDEFGGTDRTTKSIVDLIKKYAKPVGGLPATEEYEAEEPHYEYDGIPWLVTQWSVEEKQLLVGVHASMKEANTPQLNDKWLAAYQAVPEEIRQAMAAAGLKEPELQVLSGEI